MHTKTVLATGNGCGVCVCVWVRGEEGLTHLAPVTCVGVTDLLNEVEDEPGGRDDHEDDKGDGDKDQRAAVDVLGRAARAHRHRHQHGQVAIQQRQQLLAVRLGDHHRHRVARAWRGGGERERWQ